MAFRHAFLPELHLAILEFYGYVDGPQLKDATIALFTDPDWVTGYRQIVDGRAITEFVVQPHELTDLSKLGLEPVAGTGPVAVVQRRWLVRLIGELVLRITPSDRPTRIFDDLAPALSWLGLPPGFDPAAPFSAHGAGGSDEPPGRA